MSTEEHTDSDVASISDELEQLWKESMEQCEQLERMHNDILLKTSIVQSLVEEEDGIPVMYQGVTEDLMDVLHGIHQRIIEDPNQNLGSMLETMLESYEFKQ